MHRFRLVVLIIFLLPINFVSADFLSTSQPDLAQETPPLLKIGEVQGSVGEGQNPQTLKSPYRDKWVQVSGVITNLVMLTTDSRVVNGFFMQELAENSDGNPNTSDGILVNIGTGREFQGYAPIVGDIVTVEGRVEEYYDNTRLTRLNFITLEGHIDNLEEAILPMEINPVGTFDEISLMYEKLEGMRVFAPAGSLVVSSTHVFTSTNDTEVYVVRADHPIAQREDVFTRRVFLDTHPLDDGELGENPYRISVEANILKGQAGDYEINLPAYHTYDIFTTPLVGNLIYAFGRYTLQIETLPETERTISPTDNAPVMTPDRATQFSVGTFNVKNLYDYYNDPFDTQDNPNDGRFNYVPFSVEQYDVHVTKIATAIVNELHAPDILALQELEDQDICTNGGQVYGTCSDETDNADGLPDVLQDVVTKISEITEGEIVYLPALDRDSADDRGITQGYLYRADRVQLVVADVNNLVLGSRPDDPDAQYYEFNQEVSNPKSLNQRFGPATPLFDRPPLVGLFRIYREVVGSDDFIEIYLSNNHFKSDPTAFVALREGQALYNLSFYNALQAANPDTHFIVIGDLNSFPESQELSVLEPTLNGLYNEIPVESRYTYIFAGQTQTLDYIYASPNLVAQLAAVRVAHINADFAYLYENDPSVSWRSADHDPIVATFNFVE